MHNTIVVNGTHFSSYFKASTHLGHFCSAESEAPKVVLWKSDVLSIVWFAKMNMEVTLQKWVEKVNFN